MMPQIFRAVLPLCLALLLSSVASGQDWKGYERIDLEVGGRPAILVKPAQAESGKPWLWRMGDFEEEPAFALALLERGLHVAWIETSETFGSPAAVELSKTFHNLLTSQHGLSQRALVLGLGMEGLLAHNYAADHPLDVAAVIAANPVCDTKSYPAGLGIAEGDPVAWARCLEAWGLDEEGAREIGGNPIDRVTDLAGQGVPILHVVGTTDLVVPFSENSQVLVRRMRQVGGRVAVIEHDGGHRPFLPGDVEPLVAYALRHTVQYDDYLNLRGGLDRFRAAAEGGAARIAFVGGSITYNPGWTRFVQGDLLRAYLESEITFAMAAVPSLDSTAHAFRLQDDLIASGDVDLVILEAAVNDATNGRTAEESIRGLEGTIRSIRTAWPDVDILLVHFPDEARMRSDAADLERPTVAAMERVAEHYGLPSLDLAADMATRVAAGEFSWQEYGGVHPLPFGQRLIWRSIQRIMREANITTGARLEGEVAPRTLPEPLDALNYGGGIQVEPSTAHAVGGWNLIPAWAPPQGERGRQGFVQRPTLEATTAGAELTFPFEGVSAGLLVLAGPDAGAIEWSVDGGDFTRVELFTEWSAGLHLPWYHVLTMGLKPGPHVLTLRSAETEGRSVVRIQEFLVQQR